MKKLLPLILLLTIATLTSAFSLREWRASLYSSIKAEAEKSFSDLFGRKVTIQSAGGIVAGQIVLKEVVVSEIGRAEEVVLNFNPLKYAYYKGDMVPALTKITVTGGDFQVIRDRNDRWNVLASFLPENPQANPPPPLRSNVVFKKCRVSYLDQLGFHPAPREFRAHATEVNGALDLRRKDQLFFYLSAKVPELVKARGGINLKTGKFDLNASASQLNFEKWATYVVPLPGFSASGGIADLSLRISSPKTKGWPARLVGEITFSGAAGHYQNYELSNTTGKLSIADENLAFADLKTEIDRIPVNINGRFYDFSKQNLELTVELQDVELKTISTMLSQVKDWDLQGKTSATFRAEGTAARPRIAGTANISEGELFRQKFRAAVLFSFKDNILTADADLPDLYRGDSSAKASIDLSREQPQIALKVKFSKIDLASLAQNAPGLEGRAEGVLELSGAGNDLRGKISAALSQALAFGQPINSLAAELRVRHGDFYVENFRVASEAASLLSRGKIDRNLNFDLQAEAVGMRLAGEGIFGKMEATVNKFTGSVRGKFDRDFLASPLRNIFASGEAVLSEGQIGEQFFDRAQGKIDIGGGKIEVQEASIQRLSSVLNVGGQTGFGLPTRLKLSGEKIDLADLKILNHLLPAEARDPEGTASLEVEVTGALSLETQITSLDSLLDLSAKGKISVVNGSLAELPVSSAGLSFVWEERALSVPSCQVQTPDSSLDLTLEAQRDGQINASLKGTVDFARFRKLTGSIGKIEGRAGISAVLAGRIDDPGLGVSFWIDKFRFNEIFFDQISGSLTYTRDKLTLPKPLLFKSGLDRYSVSGSIGTSLEGAADLDLKIVQADLSSTYRLFDKIYGEFSRRVLFQTGGKALKLNLSNLTLPTWTPYVKQNRIKLYSANGVKNYFLKAWSAIRLDFEKSLAVAPEENLGGKLSGEFQLRGKLRDPSGAFSARVVDGYFRSFEFDRLLTSGQLKDQEIQIEKLVLSKDRGNLSVRGSYNFNGNLSLEAAAANLPMDILQIVFPGKEFKGAFNLNANLGGTLQNPDYSLGASAKDVTLAGVDFDQLSISIAKRDDSFYLQDLSLLEENSQSKASGTVDLSHPGKINLEADLKGNSLGLLNLFTDEIKWIKGDSSIAGKIQGTLEDPEFQGKVEVSEGIIWVKALDSEIHNLQGKASVKNNLLQIESLTGIWAGKRTRNWPNPVGLAGTIDLSDLLAEKGRVNLNLAFSPTRWHLFFPNLYTGSLRLKELSLQGPFYFDLSRGPRLKGKVELDNAVLTLAEGAVPSGKVIPLEFSLEADLTKNVYVVMGNVATLNLSNVFMNLEVAGEGLKISGNLKYPSLFGKVLLKRGTVSIFNREFSLLSTETQKRYFPYDSEKVMENTAFFPGEEGPAGVLPNLNLTASVNVENLEKDESGKYVQRAVNILARLQGTIGAKEGGRGLKTFLSGYREDKTKSPPEMVAAPYSEEDLKVMLLPDFIKTLAGIGQPEELRETRVDTNVIMADYLSSRIQTILFRSLEREAEQKLGLESLTLEYNLGPKVREAMGVKEAKGFEEEKPAWSVGFVKGLFDRLYIDVRYAQGMEETVGVAKTTFNYQLTYKIDPIWSIIYFREPYSLSELTTGYQKVTLKAGFSFW